MEDKYFNPRTRTGCDILWGYINLTSQKFQSTHPHGVRRSGLFCTTLKSTISIHAPARGATLAAVVVGLYLFNFNPRTRTGCDIYSFLHDETVHTFQSTHPHGVRLMPPCSLVHHWYFNPRTRTGCDETGEINKMLPPRFQSTHPHGVRRFRFRRVA